MSKEGLKALLITSPVNRLFAAGFSSSAGALLIIGGEAWFFTDSRYIEAAGKAVTGAEVCCVTGSDSYYTQIKALLSARGVEEIGFEDECVTYSEYLRWGEKLSVKLNPAQKALTALRAVKTADDLEGMIAAQRIAEKSFSEILPIISTEITEKELAAELVYRMVKNGADDKSFDTIAVSGMKSSMPHGVPGGERISKGFLTIDFGARLNGWCSDTTRTLCVGKPDEEMIRVYGIVLEAKNAGIGAVRAGARASEADNAARGLIEKAGYGEYFGHGFGHGLGLDVHEAPTASKTSKDILKAGMVISAEPGIYLPGRWGVRLEDVLYVTESGCKNLTNLTSEMIVI